MSQRDELLTLNQIALRAGVQPSAVSNWKRRYAAEFPRPRDRDLYSAREVDAWLDRRQLGRSSPRRSLEAKLFEATDRLRGRVDVRTAFAAILTVVTVASLRPEVVETGNVFEAAVDIERAGEAPRGSLCGPLDQFANDERAMQALEDIVLGMGGEDPTRAFESLLSRGLQSSLAESQSSSRLLRLLAGLISRDAANVLDPACGVGGLLLELAESDRGRDLVGLEIADPVWAICVQRMLIHRLPVRVDRRDFLRESATARFDAVAVHPPLGLGHREGESTGMPLAIRLPPEATNQGEFAWILAAQAALTDEGRAVVVSSPSTVFASGAARAIRHELIRTGSVQAVIALPLGTIPVQGVQPIVWVLRRPSAPSPVLLIDATHPPNDGSGDDPTESAADEVRAWTLDPEGYAGRPGFSTLVDVLDLLAGDVVLTPAHWTAEAPDPIDAAQAIEAAYEVLNRETGMLQQVPRLEALPISAREPRLVSLQDLVAQGAIEVERPRHTNRRDLKDSGRYPYATGITSEGQLRMPGYLDDLAAGAVITQPGDVVLATMGTIGAIVDHAGGHVLGSAAWRISVPADSWWPVEVLALLLNSERVRRLALGSTAPRLRHPKEVTVPDITREEAVDLARIARSLSGLGRGAARLAEAAVRTEAALAAALESGVVLSAPQNRGAR